MKFNKKNGSFLDRLLGESDSVKSNSEMTYKEERENMEKEAVKFEEKRIVQASQYPNVGNQIFKTPEKPETNDHDRVIQGATKELGKHLKALGADGHELSPEEIHVVKSHNDRIDDSLLTDEATIAFQAKFATVREPKTLRFVVSFKYDADVKYEVEDKFFDVNDNEYKLSSEALLNCLANEESEAMNKVSQTPVVAYNAETESMEVIPTKESSERVATRLTNSGWEVKKEYVDRTRGPEFGKVCYRVANVMDISKLKAEAALGDDEWLTRAQGDQTGHKDLSKPEAWNDRGQEKGKGDFKHNKDLDDKNKKNWPERTIEKGGAGNYGNPYDSEAKILMNAQAAKKEDEGKEGKVVQAALEQLDISEAVANLEKLIK